MDFALTPDVVLPEDGCRGMLIGRVWLPNNNKTPAGEEDIAEDLWDEDEEFLIPNSRL